MDEVGIKERIIFGLLAALIGLFLLISLYRFFKDNKPGKIEPPFHGVYIRTYDELPKDITIADGFFDGWPNPPSKEKHHEIMENSYMTIVAVDFGTRQIVGFINILSDGVMSAYFPLLEVIPTYKKQGIGKRLLDRAYAETKDIYMIDFACDDDMVDYYEKFGLYRTNAMIKRNYDKI
ncbi:MAG: GNAT family N-acetyltransferase [Tissierellia bacterium]|nr:GNAT family N-acetyltransferase [Tissierellia bacterium]